MYEPPRNPWDQPKSPQRYLGLSALVFDVLVLGVVATGALALWVFVFDAWMPAGADLSRPESLFGGDNGARVEPLTVDARAAIESTTQAAVLTVEDLPAGWTIDTDSEDSPLVVGGECAVWTQDPSQFIGHVATTESPVFSGPSGQALSSGVVGFQDDEAATYAYDSTVNTAAKCRQPLEAAMIQALKADFEKEPELAGVPVEFDVAFADLPLQSPGGDSSNAYRFYIDIHLPGETRELTIDVLMTRVRRFVGVFSHFAPAGSDITQDLAYRFVGKLTGATAQVDRQPFGRSPELQ